MWRTGRVGIGGWKLGMRGVSARQRRGNAGQDGAEQAVPGQEQVIGGYGADVLEQAGSGLQTLAGSLPLENARQIGASE